MRQFVNDAAGDGAAQRHYNPSGGAARLAPVDAGGRRHHATAGRCVRR